MKAGAGLPALSWPKGRMEPRPRLPLDARPVDRPPVEPGRSAGLQPRHAEAKRSERAGKAERWRLPHATARASLQPGKELAAKEGAGGDDNGRGGQQPPVAQHHPGYRVAIGVAFDARGLALHNLQIVIAAEQRLDGGAIEPAVGLRARPLHRRTLAPVEPA